MSKAGQPAFAFGLDWLKMTVSQRKSVDFHKKTLKIEHLQQKSVIIHQNLLYFKWVLKRCKNHENIVRMHYILSLFYQKLVTKNLYLTHL